jgi:hypothetical protein
MSQTKAQLIDNLVSPITGALGSAAAPTFSFTADPNTGLYSPGADQLAISTGGTGRLFIDSSGRLLVGTSTARSNFFGTTLSSLTQTEGIGGSTARGSLSVINNDVSNNPPYVLLGRSGAATLGSNAVVVSGSRLGTLTFHGADGTSFIEAATVAGEVDGTPGSTDMPGRLVFSTTADGAASPTERLRIDSSGRVGIGVSSPAVTLEAKSSGNTVFRAWTSDTATSNQIVFDNTSNYNYGVIGTVSGNSTATGDVFGLGYTAAYATDFTPVLSWTANTGRVGIGSTVPQDALSVYPGSTGGISLLDSSNSARSRFFIDNTGGIFSTGIRTNNYYIDLDSSGAGQSAIRFYTGTGAIGTGTERGRWTSDGKFLVGTTSPPLGSPLLHVQGSQSSNGLANFANNTNSTDVNHGIINLINTATGAVGNDARIMFSFRQVGSSTGLDPMASIGAIKEAGTTAAAIQFNTRSSDAVYAERMRITSGGNVFIGTTTAGGGGWTTANAGAQIVQYSATSDTRSLYEWKSDNAGSNTTAVYIESTGKIYARTTTVQAISSERRLKENIVPLDIDDAWETIKSVPFYSYNFIGADPSNVLYGPMADEVPDAMRVATSQSDDVGVIHTYDNGMLQARLYVALQTALNKIETLEAKVAALESA